MKFSLGKKAALLIIIIVVIVSTVSIFISSGISMNIIEMLYSNRSEELASVAAASVDAEQVRTIRDEVMDIFYAMPAGKRVDSSSWGSDEFNSYLTNYSHVTEMPEFNSVRDDLRKFLAASKVESVYVTFVDTSLRCSVYLVDAGYEDACPPGCIDPLFIEDTTDIDTDLKAGVAPTISKTDEYGWLIAAGMPILDKNGERIAFAAVDLSMNEVNNIKNRYYFYTVFILFILALVISLIAIIIVNRFLVKPINVLSDTSEKYYDDGEEITRHKFARLKIETGDELEILANSMKQMEKDINDHIESLIATKEKLEASREQAQEMNQLANIDALTRVKNKRAYDSEEVRLNAEIRRGGARFAIAMVDLNDLKLINDVHGHDKGDIAIKSLCHIICETFKHSPVFRVGGDEFVVILKNHDLHYLKELIGEFEQKIASVSGDPSLKIWESTSAALGYAEYDPDTDQNAQSVLKRADEEMYKRKKEMKERK